MLTGTCLVIISLSATFLDPDWKVLAPGSLAFLLPAALVLFFSVLVNRIYVISDVFSRNTLWPGHAFILLTITIGTESSLRDIIIHGLASILIVNEMLNVNYNRDARLSAFNIAFCAGIASFFQPSLILMVPFLLLGLRNLKPLNFKEYVIFFLGVATPYYFLWAYAYLSGDTSPLSDVFNMDEWFSLAFDIHWSLKVRWLLAFLIVIIAHILLYTKYNSLGVRSRRIATAIFYLHLGILAALLCGEYQPALILYAATAFAFPATLLMLSYFNKPYLELIHIIFVGIILAALLLGNI